MTAGQFREIDLDLLADYVGGALAGTPDEAVVARLVADDPAWAQAYATLAPAVGRVRETLADWGAADLAMPPEITARLVDALAETDSGTAETGSDTAEPRRATTIAPTDTPARVPGQSSRRPSGVPDAGRMPGGRDRPPARARRRRSRWVSPLAVAAAFAAFAGFGANQLGWIGGASDGAGQASDTERADALSGPAESGPPAAVAAPAAERLFASGTDYTPATLDDAVTSLAPTRATFEASSGHSTDAGGKLSAVAPFVQREQRSLQRLADPGALAACLDAVASEHNRGPVTVDLVDYAAFEKTPALVIAFVDQAGERWAWVAGPGCGSSESGADTRYRTRVG